MKVLYITFIDFGDFSSGSGVRPQKIYDAFLAEGHEVKLLEGEHTNLKQRRKNVKDILKWLKTNAPDICYVEPPSGPFFNLIDHWLLYKMRLRRLPIGLFYRDAYWKFAKWWDKKGIKRFILIAMHIFDLTVFRCCCNTVFFPSKSMADLFRFKHKEILPPAGENRLTEMLDKNIDTAVYVGGVSERYGTHILLQSFMILNEEKFCNIHLKMVCRVDDDNELIAPYKNKPWLELIKASGEQLKDIYSGADIGIIPFQRDLYMDFAVPVKLMEYLSYGLPVVATDCVETADFIRSNETGIVCHDNAESLAMAVSGLVNDKDLYQKYKENSKKALLEQNLWTHRVQTIVEDLGK